MAMLISRSRGTYFIAMSYRKSSRDGRGDSGVGGSGEQENVKAVETLSNIERRLDGIVAAGNNSRDVSMEFIVLSDCYARLRRSS